ncbi:MAG: hypothetical protein ACLQJR_04110 [Stellaceae bacterium]
MRVIEEAITILRNDGDQGLTLLMGGYRVALTLDEARTLANSVRAALSDASGDSATIGPIDLAARGADPAMVVARVTEQVISWALIADAAQRK